MDQQETKHLIERYLADECTEEEKALVETWYLEQDTESVNISHERLEAAVDRVWHRLSSTKVKSLVWPRIAVAASVIFILSVGVYFLLHKAPVQQIVQRQEQDIAPGGNKAVLTLGNGQKITLTGVQNGQLAVQGQSSVSKTADGQIVYHSVAAQSSVTKPVFNSMTTPRGGQYHLILADGSNVWLNAASSIKYPTAFTGNTRDVEITGEAYFEVAHNSAKPFRVKGNGQTVEVLGTHFNINAYTDEPAIKTTLLQGMVKVNREKQSVTIKPGQQALVADNAGIKVLNNADMGQVLAWKNRAFDFDETDIQTVMRQISRWYDVDIEFTGKVHTEHISGNVSRNMNVSKVLQLLKLSGINLKVEGKKIIVK